jgi:hypothetical protein
VTEKEAIGQIYRQTVRDNNITVGVFVWIAKTIGILYVNEARSRDATTASDSASLSHVRKMKECLR